LHPSGKQKEINKQDNQAPSPDCPDDCAFVRGNDAIPLIYFCVEGLPGKFNDKKK
jgi:hypothetical protein